MDAPEPNYLTPNPEIDYSKKENEISPNFDLLYDNKIFSLQFIISGDDIIIKLSQKGVILDSDYQLNLNLNDFFSLNRYFKVFDNLKEIFNDLIELQQDNKIIITKINENCVKMTIELKVHNKNEIVNISLIKENYNQDVIFKNLVNEFNLIKLKCEKLEKENKEIKEKVKELLKWKEEYKNEVKEKFGELLKWKEEYENNLIMKNLDSKIFEKAEEIKFLNNRIINNDPSLKNKKVKYELLYRASRDGEKTGDFHKKCDNKGTTLIIIKTDKGLKFGGYTEENWGNKYDVKDPKAFCFSIDLKKIYNIRKGLYAIYGGKNYIAFNANILEFYPNILTQKGKCGSVEHSSYDNYQVDYEFNNKEKNFSTVELEVFKITLI